MLRPALFALALAPAIANAAEIDAAMHCVRGTMTSALVPATASAEQLASVALAQCADEIEMAAIAMAGAPLVHARIDASRRAVRHELYDYALASAAGPPASAVSEGNPATSW